MANPSPSTLLTPCRPVGLRRKRPSPQETNSSLLKIAPTAPTIESPATPIFTGLSRAQETIEQQENECLITNSPIASGVECVGNGERQNLKRKSSTPQEKSFSRKRPIPRNIIKSCLSHGNEDLVKKTAVVSNNSPSVENVDNDGKCATDSEDKRSHTSCTSESGKSVRKYDIPSEITMKDVEQLKERIAEKEKRLKESKLAALYKKKHDFKQVEEEIECWLLGCKEALEDLQSELKKRDQSYSLTKLLDTLGIPPALIGIDEEDTV